MEYKGKLYGRLNHDIYIPLEETTTDFDLIKDKIEEFKKDRSTLLDLLEKLSDIIEENKDKIFTEQDMRNAMLFSMNHFDTLENIQHYINSIKYKTK